MSYLVDTDIVVAALHNRAQAIETFQRLTRSAVAVSIITMGELSEGAYRSANVASQLAQFRALLHGFPIIDFDDTIINVFAHERAQLRRRGMLTPDLDLLIAATAKQRQLTLATRNIRHFAWVSGLSLKTV